MPVKAFILIDTSPGKAKEVAGKIRQVAGVSSAHAVTGPHDIIAVAEAAERLVARRDGSAEDSERDGRQPESDLDRGRLVAHFMPGRSSISQVSKEWL